MRDKFKNFLRRLAGKIKIKMDPLLVICVHGIRTNGKWQKKAAEELSAKKIPAKLYDYGHYGIHKFLRKNSNDAAMEKFYEYYHSVIQDKDFDFDATDHLKRPSIIAHSLGSYLVGMCMLKHPEVKFDKIIFCGSILPVDFDWSTLHERDQVNFVRNECSSNDFWSKISGRFVSGTGRSGFEGFNRLRRIITQESFDLFRHSDFFKRSHIKNYWIPFLQKAPSNLFVKQGRQIENLSEFSRFLNMSGEIDTDCFKSLPDYTDVKIPRGLSLSWIDINPDIYTFLLDRKDNAVKGYINAMPLKNDTFSKIKLEGIDDNKIRPDDIVPFGQNQSVKIYLMSIALSPLVRNISQGLFQAHSETLFAGFIGKLRFYAANFGIRVSEFASIGWTPEGKTLCESIGMEQISIYRDKYPVYWLNLNNPAIINNRNVSPEIRKLVELYRSIPM